MKSEAETAPAPMKSPNIVAKQAARAVILVEMISAAIDGSRRCFVEQLTNSTSAIVESSATTTLRQMAPEVRARLDAMFSAVRSEDVEDGMSNAIVEQLPNLIAAHHHTILPVITALIDTAQIRPAATAEILKEIGRVSDLGSQHQRLWLLEHALYSPLPAARDGAAVGLTWMSNRHSLPYLREAAEREPIHQLRTDLQSAFDAIVRATSDASPTPEDH